MSNNAKRRKLQALAQAARPKPYDWEQARLKYADLPSLRNNFCHANINAAALGPRSELTLVLQPLVWIENQGVRGAEVEMRFGGIINFAEVKAIFLTNICKQSELAFLRYDDDDPSKLNEYFIHLAFEHVDVHLIIHCRSLTLTDMA